MTIGPTNAAAQRVAGPHLIARAPIADGPDPDMGAIPMPHVGPRMPGTPGSIRTPAPPLGAHNRALTAGIGLEGTADEERVRTGIVRGVQALP